ncbi:conserved exported hypothetical protein [Rhodococcus sp. RD6.2]|jgi:hypothetical protein|uniref:hypothetical protein n=1 Tax=Rhodococcus sp. RD6.2 TaxID=260936 RepID=UPI00063BBD8A|nr:hypothetical protein [Rhodococcus sp. RD6.2]CRK54381.1 conserved exported hypothetical protein [Rhodococcus sp. RD6.2]
MRTQCEHLALVTAVVTPLVAIGLGMGSTTAAAATPPTLSITVLGATDWTLTWDGTPAAGCALDIGGSIGAVPPSASIPVGAFPAGAHEVNVECPVGSGNASPTVTLYAPRGAENDMRTQFSNDTQGAFGS